MVRSFEGRFAVYEYMAHFGDLCLHTIGKMVKTTSIALLYGGYPLIHNSTFIKDYGYYYPEFDTQAGGKSPVEAHATHDLRLEDYNAMPKKCCTHWM